MHAVWSMRRLLLVGALAVTLVVGLIPDARAVRTQPIGPATFGVVGGVADPYALGLVRTWDADVNWCDLQPTENANVWDNLERKLAPRLDEALSAGSTGAIITLGHPAPWVFGDHPRAWRTGKAWFCGGTMASTSIPRGRDIKAGKVQYERFQRYAQTVMDFVASRYAGRLTVSFQVWNEPNLRSGINPKGKVPGAARSTKDAARALYRYEKIARDLVRGRYAGQGFTLLSSALYQKQKAFSKYYLKRHARRPLFTALSFNMYTKRGRTAPAMVRDFPRRVKLVTKQIRKHRKLRKMPIVITEFNHNLVNDDQNQYNLSPAITNPQAQRLLATASSMDALYYGFDSIVWLRPWHRNQTAVQIGDTTGPARSALGTLRGALQGATLRKCRSRKGTRTCYFTDGMGRSLQVHWRPKGSRNVKITAPSMVLQMDGTRAPAQSGDRIRVAQTPIVVGPISG